MIYESNTSKSALYINFKCGYSTIQNFSNEGKIKLIHNSFSDHSLNLTRHYKVALVRDTKKRLESFYKSKFVNVSSITQNCQKSMIPYYNEADILKGLSFDQVMLAIQKGYRDNHINPQTNIFPRDLDYKVNLDSVTDADLSMMKIKFNLDLAYKVGSTSNIEYNFKWTPWMEEIIKKLYSRDYNLLE